MKIIVAWPDPVLWPNNKAHDMAKARARKEAKHEAFYLVKQVLEGQCVPAWILKSRPLQIRITGHRPRRVRKIDLDNFQAALKATLDGIALALEVDDQYFKPVTGWGQDMPPRGRVVVEITE